MPRQHWEINKHSKQRIKSGLTKIIHAFMVLYPSKHQMRIHFKTQSELIMCFNALHIKQVWNTDPKLGVKVPYTIMERMRPIRVDPKQPNGERSFLCSQEEFQE